MKQCFKLILLVTMFTVATVQAAPRLTMDNSTFDFGYVPQNSAISHDFWLKSAGTDTLRILKIVPGWGCTKAPLEKEVIAVGDSTRLEIIFHTKTYSGPVSKRPTIQTNEGPPDKSVQIMAHVVSRPDSTYPIVLSPYKLDLSQFTEKVREKVTFKIHNVSEKKIKPTFIAGANDFFTIKLPNSINPGTSSEATLTLKSEGLKGAFEKSFTIQLDDEKKTRFTIPVKRTVQTVGTDSNTVKATTSSSDH